MPTKVGIGHSVKSDSREAGIEVARAAAAAAPPASQSLALLFATSKHDPAKLRDGIRSVLGPDVKLLGGHGVGIITREKLSYGGYEVGLALLSSDTARFDTFLEEGLDKDEHEVGVRLARQIQAQEFAGSPNLVVLYDSVKRPPGPHGPPVLNLATPLIEGMGSVLGTWPSVAGAGMLGDPQFAPGYQWYNDRLAQQAALALVLSGGVRMDTVIMHGCRPASDYHTITKVSGNVILEIDGKPALDVIANLIGSEKTLDEYPLFVTFGVNKGDKFGDFQEDEYANRLVMAIDKEHRALIMFEPDLKPGAEVQLMRRSIDFDYIGSRAEDLYRKLDGRTPLFGLYIDCVGRASILCGTEREEAEEVQKVIGSKMPLLGFYSGVEIARVGNDVQALDWTGVLCVFSE